MMNFDSTESVSLPPLALWFKRIDEENPRPGPSRSEAFLLESICVDINNNGCTEVPGELSVRMIKILKVEGFVAKVYYHKGAVATTVVTFIKRDKEEPEPSLTFDEEALNEAIEEAILLKGIYSSLRHSSSTEVPGELSRETIQRLQSKGLAIGVFVCKGSVRTVIRKVL